MQSGTDRAKPRAVAVTAAIDATVFMRSREYWLVSLCACLLTGFAGPFGTSEMMTLGFSLLYWTLLIGFSIVLLTYLSFLAYRVTLQRGFHWLLTAALAGIVSTPLILAVGLSLNEVFMPLEPAPDLGITLLQVACPAVIINMLVCAYVRLPPGYLDPRKKPSTQSSDAASAWPPTVATDDQSLFFDNLPAEIGRDVVSIRADDHYIEVRTTLGSARVLMRLRDAETALAALSGMRVHRSWWVNLAHAASLETRRGGAGLLTMDTGDDVPVSRGQVEAVRFVLDARG